jgi:putative ABC transport system permease protein
MLYDLKLAWRNLTTRPIQTLITIFVVALAIALSVTVVHLNDGLRRGIVQASDPFGVLVVGAKGSAQQLVLSTLLLQGTPVGNIPHTIYADLVADERVALAVPLAMGDNVGGARIIGTDERFFELRPSLQSPPAFQLEQGRLFDANFEAVLGSRAAINLGLEIGDRFVPAHGVAPGLASDEHDVPHTVVGILGPSQTPYDNAVLTNVASVHAVHAPGAAMAPFDAGAADAHHDGDEGEEHADESRGMLGDEQEITAVLVRPTGFAEGNQLWQEFYTGVEAQAAFPGRELGGLFDLLNQGQQLLTVVGYLAAVMAALTLFLAIYSATGAREHLLAIMRGLGASRASVFRVVLFETVLLALIGALLGRLLGYVVAWLIAGRIAAEATIPVSIRYLPGLELYLWVLPLGLGLLAGLLPAWQAYRSDVVDRLFPA